MILIRCDSSYEIGTGHVIRCLNLAQYLRALGEDPEFVCENKPGNINDKIIALKFKIHTGHDLDIVQKLKASWVIVDHYFITKDWEHEVKKSSKVFVIDDLLREHDCDVLLDQNFRENYDSFDKLVPRNCQKLLGPKYCLLSPTLTRPNLKDWNYTDLNILVFFGGADEQNNLEKFYQAFSQSSLPQNIRFKLVALSSHKHFERIRLLKSNPQCQVIIDPPDWNSLLLNSNFFIGSGGTVTWERLYIGLPGAVVAVADNQIAVSQQVASAGLQYYWGESRNIDYLTVFQRLKSLLSKHDELRQMAQRGMESVDKLTAQKLINIFNLKP